MSARDDYPRLAVYRPEISSNFDGQITAALDEIDRLRAELVRAIERPVGPALHSSERDEAKAIVDAYLSGFPSPYEAWHHIDNAHNDLLREVVKQLVGRCLAAIERTQRAEQDADQLAAELAYHGWTGWSALQHPRVVAALADHVAAVAQREGET